MYYYIYDSFLNAKKYRKILERIEVRLGGLGVSGKIKRLNILNHQKETIEESIRRGAKTIVLVGDDHGIVQAIDTLAKYDIPVGIIPVGNEENLRIARTLGIPPLDLACEVLSRRTIARLDLGKIASHYFLTSAEVQATTFRCIFPRRTFRVEPIVAKATLTVMNLALAPLGNEKILRGNPRDGILELIIRDATTSFIDVFRPQKTQKIPSIFPIQEIELTEPEGAIITMDGWRSVKLPLTVTIAPQKLRVIIGRERLFS
ncbi:MAG: diacylglycerol kinase family protein [bacterium]|nr:diacylglycerol kinase family protein [bacterium]